jgi:hypothetical protein
MKVLTLAILAAALLALPACGKLETGASARKSNEALGLRPPACINEEPVKCEKEKGEGHQEGQESADKHKLEEAHKRIKEETEGGGTSVLAQRIQAIDQRLQCQAKGVSHQVCEEVAARYALP